MRECCEPKSDRQEQLLALKGAPTQSDDARIAASRIAVESQTPHKCPLSPRQLEVLACLAQEGVEKKVAVALQCSIHTIHEHLRRARRRLCVDTTLACIV